MNAPQFKGMLVGFTLGVGIAGLTPLLLAQAGTSQPANPPAKSTQQRRFDAAAMMIKTFENRNSNGRIDDPELWHTWQFRWLESAKAMAPDAKARVQVHTEFRDRMKRLLAQAEKGRDYYGNHEVAIADYFLAEAEELLEQERSQLPAASK